MKGFLDLVICTRERGTFLCFIWLRYIHVSDAVVPPSCHTYYGVPPITYYQFTPEVIFKGDEFFRMGGVVNGSICDLLHINLLLFNGRIACIYYHRFPECEDLKFAFE